MQFDQTSVPQLYSASGNGTAVPGTILFLLPRSTPALLPSIPFPDSWTLSGTYIFLEQALAAGTEEEFAEATWQYLADPRMAGAKFAWFSWPSATGPVSGTVIPIVSTTNGFATAHLVEFALQNVSVVIAMETAVAIDETNFTFNFAQADSSIFLAVDGVQAGTVGATMTIPFTDALSGCLEFAIVWTEEELATVNAGLQFYYASTELPGALSSLSYPIFNDGLTLYANIDPLAALTPARTFFAFTASDAGQTSPAAAPAVASYYSSTLGDAFTLQPLTGSAAPTQFAALVFALDPRSNPPGAGDPYSLVPYGDFALQSARTTGLALMGGLSGVESFAVTSGTSVLSFFPGQTAFAQGFVPGSAKNPPPVTFVTPPTTSFAFVSQPSAQLGYFAQPDQSILYQPGQSTAEAFQALSPMSLQAAALATPAASASFPLLPYSGIPTDNVAFYQQLESQVVSPMRRQALLSASQPMPKGGDTTTTVTGTTPQGLLATFSSDLSQWLSVTLAQTPSPAGGATPQLLALSNPGQSVPDTNVSLQTALQTNKLFLVISDDTVMTPYLPTSAGNTEINLAGWVFDLDPASTWGSGGGSTAGTIVIFKFSDLTVEQLAQQTGAWTDGTVFNADPAATSLNITTIIEEAQHSSDPAFATFLNAVTSASWNGILILNAGLGTIPANLTGLMAGIDASLLYGHHIGIELSNVALSNGTLAITTTSIFALIDYQAPQPLTDDGAPYQFQVEELKVLFLNSAIADFTSTLDLQINQLFGEPATLESGRENIVQLLGVYQSDGTYVFTTNGASVFDLKSAVFNAVQLTSGQFITVGTTGAVTTSNFVFWGVLDFQALPKFDVFSFGRLSGATTPAGLSVGNLAIVMTQQAASGGGTPPAQFAFDASQLSIDLAGSTTRPGSFYPNFPLTLSGITQAPAGAAAPQSFGYMSVQTPLDQSSLAYPWYSLDFDLNLGTPGALAAAAGFIASLTVAWSPGSSSDYTVFAGLQLPGSSGSSNSISIEGLFDITFKTIAIVPATTNPDAYILILYDIGFSFMSFTFPPSGQVNFVLFGDPSSPGGQNNSSLGWYAAYAKPATSGTGGTTQASFTTAARRRRLTAGGRR